MTFQKLICANSFEIKYGPNDVRPLMVFISFIQCTSLTLFCRYIKMLFGRCYVPYCFSVVGGLVAESSLTLVTPGTVACQAPPSMEFSRQEYWSGCHFLLQGIIPDQGVEPVSLALAGRFFAIEPPGKATIIIIANIRLGLCVHKHH